MWREQPANCRDDLEGAIAKTGKGSPGRSRDRGSRDARELHNELNEPSRAARAASRMRVVKTVQARIVRREQPPNPYK